MKVKGINFYLSVTPEVFVSLSYMKNCPFQLNEIKDKQGHPVYELRSTVEDVEGSFDMVSLNPANLEEILHREAVQKLGFKPVSKINYPSFTGDKQQIRGLNGVMNGLSKMRIPVYATFTDEKGREHLLFGRNPGNSVEIRDIDNIKEYLGF